MSNFQGRQYLPKNDVNMFSKNSMPSSESPYVPASFGSNDNNTGTSNTDLTKPGLTNINETDINLAPASVTIESKSRKSGFRTFIILGILIILLIYSFVTYEYFKNKSLKDKIKSDENIAIEQNTLTPVFDPKYVAIENGSIIYKTSESTVILVDKSSFPTTGITGFSRVVVSPNNQKLCFESVPPSTKPALFISDNSGNNSVQISTNKSNCLWKKDGSTIYYIGKEIGLSNLNIYKYDLSRSTEDNLTSTVFSNSSPDFAIVGLSSDETKLICSYIDPTTEEVQRCEIELSTSSFSTL